MVGGAFSVGPFYLPNAAALAMVAVWPPLRGEWWERWFAGLVALTGVVGAVWYYSFISSDVDPVTKQLPHSYLGGPFRALTLIVIAVVMVVRLRDLGRGYAARGSPRNEL